VFRLILWHRDTDSFEDGQWLKQKVYVDRCDLSPDGQHFLYFTLGGDWSGESEGAYTALARPPYFTALSLFPEGSTWGGGGRFLDDRLYVADGGNDIIGRDAGLVRLHRKSPSRDCPSGLHHVDGRCAKLGREKAERAFARVVPTAPALSLYDTRGGVLYRRLGEELQLIRDFNDMSFEPMQAPYDWRDDHEQDAPPAAWHPLDQDPQK